MKSLTLFFGRRRNTTISVEEYERRYDKAFSKKLKEKKNKKRKLNESQSSNIKLDLNIKYAIDATPPSSKL